MNKNELSPIEILEKVEGFYNNAWNKLIVYNTIILAIIGIVVPLIIQWWQNRNLKLKEDTLKRELNEQLEIKFKEYSDKVSSVLDEKIKSEIEEIKKSQEKLKCGLEGSHFHIQANTEDNIKEKFKSLIWAADGYIGGEDFLNLVVILDAIVEVLPKLNKEDIMEAFVEDADFESLISKLDKLENNSPLLPQIRKIKIINKKLPEKPSTNSASNN